MELFVAPHEQMAHDAVMEALRGHHERREQAYLLVPEQFTLQSDIHLLEALAVNAVMDIKVKSFASLAREVLGRIEGASRTFVGRAARELVFYQAIAEENENLAIYKNAHLQSGVLTAISDSVAALHAAGISAEGLSALADREDLTFELRRKCVELGRIQQRYETLLGDRYQDVEARLQTLLEVVPKATYLRKVHLYFDAFQSMSPLELAIVEALNHLGVAVHVVVTLPYGAAYATEMPAAVGEHEAYAGSWAFLTALRKIAGASLRIREVHAAEAVLPDLAAVAQGVFSQVKTPPLPSAPHLRLMQSPSTEIEVEAVAALLRKRVVDDGLRWRDITVSVTRPEAYFPLIRRIFAAHGIPVFIDQKRYITENPLLQSIFAAIAMVEHQFRPEDVFAYLKGGLSAIDGEALQSLERHATARKLRGNLFFKESSYVVDEARFHSAEGLAMACEDARLAQEGARVLKAELEDFYLSCRKVETVRHFSTAFYHFITRPEWTEGWHQLQAEIGAWPDEALVQENEQIVEAIIGLLEQLVTALGDRTMPFKEYARLLREGLEKISIGIIPPAQDQVLVGALGRTRTSRAPVQLILGLSDAWYPAQSPETGIFDALDQAALKEVGLALGRTSEETAAEEAMALFQAFTRPTERLVLSWPGSDAGGQTMNRSRLIRRVEEVVEDGQVIGAYALLERLKSYSEPIALRWTLKNLQKLSDGTAVSDSEKRTLGTYYRYFMQENGPRRYFLQTGMGYTNRRPPLAGHLGERLYPALTRGRASVSELESMCACPYQHFIRYGIRPHEEERLEMQYREIGTLIHAALRELTQVYSGKLKTDSPLNEAEVIPLIRAAVARETDQVIGKNRAQNGRNQVFAKRLKGHMERSALQIFRQLEAGDFKPIGQEVRFGKNQALPEIILDTGVETIRLEGIIDRIDAADDAVRVIDYKTGSKSFDPDAVAGGLQLQLLLYLRAALASGTWDKAGGIFYLRVKDLLILNENDDPSDIANAIVQALMLDGLVIDDPAILEKMDPGVTESAGTVLRLRGRSKAISQKNNVIAEERFDDMMRYAEDMANCAAQNALAGYIANEPMVIGNQSSCHFCRYQGICRFEPGMPERTASAEDIPKGGTR